MATSSSSPSSVKELVKREVPDWDDDVASTSRFKALSGHRSDWEPRLRFWKDLIVKVARHQGTCIIRSSEVKTVWFARGGLTPLCMDQVLHEMCISGDILSQGGLVDPTSGRLYRMLRRAVFMIGKSLSSQENLEDTLILKILLQERATDVIKILGEGHWTSTCIITMEKFQSICKGSDEAAAILGYLSECGKAQYLSIRKKDFIEVSEAIKIGARAIKENMISVEEVHVNLQELDENITAQNLVNEALETMPLQPLDFEDEDMEEDFKNLEIELADEMPMPQNQEADSHKVEMKENRESDEMLSHGLSNLKLEPESA